MNENWFKIPEALNKIPWEGIVRFIKLLTVKQPFALIVILSLLVSSIYLGKTYLERFNKYEEIVRDTLKADLVATPQNFKGLEAFILSKLEHGMIEDVKGMQIDPAFREYCKDLKAKVLAFQSIKTKSLSGLQIAPGENDGKILTDNHENGFLFLPVYILRPPLNTRDFEQLRAFKENHNINAEQSFIRNRIKGDIALQRDILLTGYLANTLQKFTNTRIANKPVQSKTYIQGTPAQVYMITKNGINRIFSDKKLNPSKYYGNQFSATTFFPSRPYFWPIFQENKSGNANSLYPAENEKLGEYFYVSQPYMDLGGSGIVITLGRGLEIDGITQAAICFDLPVGDNNSVYNLLKDRFDAFDAKIVEVKFRLFETGSIEHDLSNTHNTNPSALDTTQNNLVSRMRAFLIEKRQHRQLAEVFGNIQVINSFEVWGTRPEVLQISVPSAQAVFDEDSRTGTFVLVELNLAEYTRKTSYIALGASSAFGIMTLLLAYFWWSSNRDYREAFERVAGVMYHSPIPYVLLDNKDRIRDLNLSFCVKLGNSPNVESIREFKKRKFESLLADDHSRAKYKEVQEKRKKREQVEPYPLSLKAFDGSHVEIWVVSADIPSVKRGPLPETFGIFLDAQPTSTKHSKSRDEQGNIIAMRDAKRSA